MPWAIHSFEMTTVVCCSYVKHRGTCMLPVFPGRHLAPQV